MEGDAKPAGGLSVRAGTLLLRSVSTFLARGRRAAAQCAAARRRHMPPAHKLPPRLLDALLRKTHFTRVELENLHAVYRKLVALSQPARGVSGGSSAAIAKPAPKVEGIDADVFRDVLHNTLSLVTEPLLGERTYAACERAGEGALRFEPWARALSTLLRGTPPERARHCFVVYDLNADGYITKDEMFALLKNCLLKQPGDEDPDEGVKDLVELVLRKLDADKDGRVSLEDYLQSVTREPLLMEAFGQCLPADTDAATFLDTLAKPI